MTNHIATSIQDTGNKYGTYFCTNSPCKSVLEAFVILYTEIYTPIIQASLWLFVSFMYQNKMLPAQIVYANFQACIEKECKAASVKKNPLY